MVTRMAHFGLCVLLEFYIQLKTTLAPGFSLETRNIVNPPPPLTFTIYPNGGGGWRAQKRTFQEITKLFQQSHCCPTVGL